MNNDKKDDAGKQEKPGYTGSLIHTPEYADPELCCGFGCSNCKELYYEQLRNRSYGIGGD